MADHTLIYNGVDITDSVSIRSAIHDMRTDGNLDSLTVVLNDPTGIWSKWAPSLNDTIVYRCGNSTTGKMYLQQFRAENGAFTLYALSAPPKTMLAHARKWEGTSFLSVAGQVAAGLGMSLKTYGVSDGSYAKLRQDNMSDLQFLWWLCRLEGCSMLCYNGGLILFSGTWQDSQSSQTTIQVGENGKFVYSDSSGAGVSGCTVRGYDPWYETTTDPYIEVNHLDLIKKSPISASFSAGDGLGSVAMEARLPATTTDECYRFAKGLTRDKNQYLKKGRFVRAIIDGLTPGSVITVNTDKAGKWNGKQIVYRVRNDYVRNSSTIFFRSPLSGY